MKQNPISFSESTFIFLRDKIKFVFVAAIFQRKKLRLKKNGAILAIFLKKMTQKTPISRNSFSRCLPRRYKVRYMIFIHPQDTPEVAIIVNKPPPPKILNEIKLQDTDLLGIARRCTHWYKLYIYIKKLTFQKENNYKINTNR